MDERTHLTGRSKAERLKFRDILGNKSTEYIHMKKKRVSGIISSVGGDADLPHSLCLCKNTIVAGLPPVR